MFQLYKLEAVMHFTCLKVIDDNVAKLLLYYNNNLGRIINLLDNCKSLVFSSSAIFYDQPANVPYIKDYLLHVTNPHRLTKLINEDRYHA